MTMVRPTEEAILDAAAAIIRAVQIGAPPAALVTKVVPRWMLNLTPGEAIPYLRLYDNTNKPLPLNAWVMTTQSWQPDKVKSQQGYTQTPHNFVPGFDDAPGSIDPALMLDYKIKVTGSLRVWQLVAYRQGESDTDNSERDAMRQRQAVIDKFSANPRIGLSWFDLEHTELKFPNISILPFDTESIHVAQGTIQFSFTYVASAA